MTTELKVQGVEMRHIGGKHVESVGLLDTCLYIREAEGGKVYRYYGCTFLLDRLTTAEYADYMYTEHIRRPYGATRELVTLV